MSQRVVSQRLVSRVKWCTYSKLGAQCQSARRAQGALAARPIRCRRLWPSGHRRPEPPAHQPVCVPRRGSVLLNDLPRRVVAHHVRLLVAHVLLRVRVVCAQPPAHEEVALLAHRLKVRLHVGVLAHEELEPPVGQREQSGPVLRRCRRVSAHTPAGAATHPAWAVAAAESARCAKALAWAVLLGAHCAPVGRRIRHLHAARLDKVEGDGGIALLEHILSPVAPDRLSAARARGELDDRSQARAGASRCRLPYSSVELR
mmetsp:Transcript_11046/g.28732  ORF Transcript_11046/g.28732 Transcript_11046/m.28732 type:complete len:259 (-) Transcript_11046:796-1572(-)